MTNIFYTKKCNGLRSKNDHDICVQSVVKGVNKKKKKTIFTVVYNHYTGCSRGTSLFETRTLIVTVTPSRVGWRSFEITGSKVSFRAVLVRTTRHECYLLREHFHGRLIFLRSSAFCALARFTPMRFFFICLVEQSETPSSLSRDPGSTEEQYSSYYRQRIPVDMLE